MESGGKRTDTGSVRRCFGWIFTFFLPTRFTAPPRVRMHGRVFCSSRSFQAIFSRPHSLKRRWASSSARNRRGQDRREVDRDYATMMPAV